MLLCYQHRHRGKGRFAVGNGGEETLQVELPHGVADDHRLERHGREELERADRVGEPVDLEAAAPEHRRHPVEEQLGDFDDKDVAGVIHRRRL